MSITIKRSFSEALPHWPATSHSGGSGPTGRETEYCEPPAQALATPLSAWTGKADRALSRVDSVLKRIYLAEVESCRIISEGDVVASSAVSSITLGSMDTNLKMSSNLILIFYILMSLKRCISIIQCI